MAEAGAEGRQVYRMAGIAIEERVLDYGDTAATPDSVADDLLERMAGGHAFSGQCKRFGIRPGFDLSLYDFTIAKPFAGSGSTAPCLRISVMLDGDGEGWLAGALQQRIAYRPATTYFAFMRARTSGHYVLPAGCRFRIVELRFGTAFLARLGALSLFAAAGADHPLHRLSDEDIWIGTLPTTRAVQAAALAILAAGLGTDPDAGPGTGSAVQGSDLAIEARALDILSEGIAAMRRADRSCCCAGARQASVRDARLLDNARAMMLAELDRPWTIRMLARAAGLNEKKLKRGFRDRFGAPVHGFLLRERLAAGRAMIAQGAASITEVSIAIGYANPSHFARLFRREFGVSPSAFAVQSAGTVAALQPPAPPKRKSAALA